MKTKKITALILAAVAIALLFTGCGDKKNKNSESTTKIVEASLKDITINTDGVNDIELEKIDIAQTKNSSWIKRASEGSVWTLTALYDTVNETVSEVTITIEIPKSSDSHDSIVAKYERAKANLDKLNDPNISAAFIKSDNSTTVEMKFKALNEADRARRIACIEGVLDIEADEDCSFRLNSLDTGLTLRSFKKA